VAAIKLDSSVKMKKQSETNTMFNMHKELRSLLTSADNLLRLFRTDAALKRVAGAKTATVNGWAMREKFLGEGLGV